MDLFYRQYGAGPTLIILHGLYGASDNWTKIARMLESDFEIYLIDQRNHGQSPHDPSNTYENMRQDLHRFMMKQDIRKAVLLGHSMGGKTVMSFAAHYPEMVNALVVVDIAPKSYYKVHASSIRTIDHATIMEAMMDVDFGQISSRKDVDGVLARTIPSERVRLFLMKNLRRHPDNSFSWRLNIEALHHNLEHILSCVVCDDFRGEPRFTGFPILFIRGSESSYILDEDQDLIRAVFPFAEFINIPNAGHWLHVEQPELLVQAIQSRVLD